MTRARVVVIATTAGYDGVPHAGGNYMKALCDLTASVVDLTVIVPGSRTNRAAAERTGAPRSILPLGLEPSSSFVWKAANRLSLKLDGRLRRCDPGMPYLPLLVGLARSREARAAVRAADVIDLQWSDSIRLVHVLQRLNPRARIVGTFHDVMSQSFSREPQDTDEEQRYWKRAARRSRRHEARMVKALEQVLTFSDKDVELLGSPPHARVVRPPLHDGTSFHHQPGKAGTGTVLLVSYLARDENNKAAVWVVSDIWPRVVSRVGAARLRLVGGGASDELKRLVDGSDGVELAGFVDDLSGEYARAAVALVPVLQGAGVKFKTIEALLHGVPVVSTTVGTEGVGPDELFVRVSDDPSAIADALVAVLSEPQAFHENAVDAQEWACSEFARDRFLSTVLSAWGLGD